MKSIKVLKSFSCFVALFVLVCAGIVANSESSKAGTFGNFEFTMSSSTNEITITGLSESGEELADIVIPVQINGYNVTAVKGLSKNDNLRTLSFEPGSVVKSISSVNGCENLTTVTLAPSIRTIESYCFQDCTSLASIAIPEGMTEIGSSAFSGCKSLATVTLPSTLTSISDSCFRGCISLKSIAIPAGVKSIGTSYYNYSDSFNGSGLESIVIPDSVTSIGGGVFANCKSLTSVTLSKNIKTIERNLFNGCTNLKNISLPIDVTSIRYDAFKGCSELETVTLGDALTSISDGVFSNCPKLTVRVVRGTIAEAYCMNRNIPYVIYASSIGGCTVDGIVEKQYTGAPIVQNLDIKLGTVPLAQNVDYTVEYSDNINVGTATLTITGTGNYIGHISKTFRIVGIDISKAKIKMKSRIKYNAKYQTPAVKVTIGGKTLSTNDYSVSYYGNCFVGTATVTVNGTGNYRGTVSRKFTINPAGTKVKAIKGERKGFTVSYKGKHIQTAGYQIQYSTSKKFAKKATKIATVKNIKKKSKTVTGLKSKKVYYVRVRTFGLVTGDKNKYCSGWSPAVKVRTK